MQPMPRLRMSFVIACMLLPATILPVPVFAGGDTNPDPQTRLTAIVDGLPKDKAEAGKMIFEKLIEAMGGRENLLKIQDSKISVDYQVVPGNRELMAVYYLKLPDKLRIDLHNVSSKACDGISGWAFDPRDGSFRNLSKEGLEELKNSALSVQGMLHPENLSVSPVFEGLAPFQGKYYLIISYANRHEYDSIYVHVDPDTFLPFMSTSIRSDSRITVVSSEYRGVAGVKLPFSIDINVGNNKGIHMAVKEWKLNSNLDNALFDKKSAKAQIQKMGQLDPSGFLDPISGPELIHKVEPVYPELALRARVSGKVLLRVTVDEEGLVRNIIVFRGHPLLDDAAITAVRQWKYRPTVRSGKPVAASIMVPIEFD